MVVRENILPSEGGKLEKVLTIVLQKILKWVAERDYDKALQDVEKLRKKYPSLTADELADKLINNKAIWAGIVGFGMGAIDTIPGLGQAIALLGIPGEAAWLIKSQVQIIIRIILIYDEEVPRDELPYLVVSSFVFQCGANFVKTVAKEASIRLTKKAIQKFLRKNTLKMVKKVAKAIGLKFTKKGLLKKVPVIAIPVNAVLNYEDIKIAGKIAKKLFSPNYIVCPHCGELYHKNEKQCPKCGTLKPNI